MSAEDVARTGIQLGLSLEQHGIREAMGRERKFRIWREHPGRWVWECTLCDPPAHGERLGGIDGWRKVVEISLPGHMKHRRFHHRHVARHG